MPEIEPPCQRLLERLDRSSRRCGPTEVTDDRDAERAGVEALRMSADHVAVDPAVAALIDLPEPVDEGVVADVVPAVAVDLVELDRAHHGRRLVGCVVVRAGGVMDDRELERVGVQRLGLADRLVRLPAAPRNDCGSTGHRERAKRNARDEAPDRVGANAAHVAGDAHLECAAMADPHAFAVRPAVRATRLGGARVRPVGAFGLLPRPIPLRRRADAEPDTARASPVQSYVVEPLLRGDRRERALASQRNVRDAHRREAGLCLLDACERGKDGENQDSATHGLTRVPPQERTGKGARRTLMESSHRSSHQSSHHEICRIYGSFPATLPGVVVSA